jgi:hypothetical protein
MQPVSSHNALTPQHALASSLTAGAVSATTGTGKSQVPLLDALDASAPGGDQAAITSTARTLAETTSVVQKWSRLALRSPDESSSPRAVALREQLASPDGMAAYLAQLNTTDVASSILKSPVASYLGA